jgi:hypothetical protein
MARLTTTRLLVDDARLEADHLAPIVDKRVAALASPADT